MSKSNKNPKQVTKKQKEILDMLPEIERRLRNNEPLVSILSEKMRYTYYRCIPKEERKRLGLISMEATRKAWRKNFDSHRDEMVKLFNQGVPKCRILSDFGIQYVLLERYGTQEQKNIFNKSNRVDRRELLLESIWDAFKQKAAVSGLQSALAFYGLRTAAYSKILTPDRLEEIAKLSKSLKK